MSEKMDLEAWKAMKKQERENTVIAQKNALQEVFQSGEALGSYLVGRGRMGSRMTSGNAALILKEKPQARAVMSYKAWRDFGRSVYKGQEGITVLVRQNGYLSTDKVFDVSQTNGNKPYPSSDIHEDTEQLQAAFKAVLSLAGDKAQPDARADMPLYYDKEEQTIHYCTEAPPDVLFRLLPAAIVQSFADEYDKEASSEELVQLYGLAVSVELCGRFGIAPIEGYAQRLDAFRNHVAEGDERATLEEVREFSRTMGDRAAQVLAQQRTAHPPDQRPVR